MAVNFETTRQSSAYPRVGTFLQIQSKPTMNKAIRQILAITLLLANLANAIIIPWTVTAPRPPRSSSHHVDGGRCEDVRVSGLSLNLRDVGLRRVDSGFADSPDISCLSLEDNDIDYIAPSSFNLMPNLLYLNLARSNLLLSNFSKIERHPHLRILVLDENLCDDGVALEFANAFPELTHLYLRNCSVKDIASLSFAPQLKYLNLSSNNLGSSKLAFLDNVPISLETLDLSHNAIENLNASSLPMLAKLRLDGNKFGRLCGRSYCDQAVLVLEGATSLRWFSASGNAITSVDSDAFDDTVNLRHLDLSHNKIDSIQKGTFEKLEDLRYLSLEGNKLKTLPELCNLDSLQYLYLANNYLHAVDNESFCQIENLTFVDLSDNRIKSVEAAAFARLARLEVLKLSNNLITTLPDTWIERLKDLRSLYVDGNRLKTLSDIGLGKLRTYAKLEHVFAQNNLIYRLYTGSLLREVRNYPNVTIQLFDLDERSRKMLSSAEDDCKCDCTDDNEVSLDLSSLL